MKIGRLVVASCLILLPCLAHSEDWTYTVRKGDTLWGLCKEYTSAPLCWLRVGPYNNVKYPKNLAPGTRIRFPVAWLRQQPAPVLVRKVQAPVFRLLSETETHPINVNDALTIGTEIQVGAGGLLVLEFADGSTMTVSENSELSLDVLSQHERTGMVDTRVNLQQGTVQTKVPKTTPRSQFEVKTPSSVAAVRGTDFRVSSVTGEQTMTRKEVFEGSVAVRNPVGDAELEKGQGIIAKKGEPLSERVILPNAPLIKEIPERVQLPLTIQWEHSQDINANHIEVVENTSGIPILQRKTEGDENFLLENLPDACYTVSVSGINADGFQGMPASASVCTYTKLAVPQDLSITRIGDQNVLQWKTVDKAQSYRIEQSSQPDLHYTVIGHVEDTQFNIDQAQPYIRVVAMAEGLEESAGSQPVKFKPNNDAEREITALIVFILAIIAL